MKSTFFRNLFIKKCSPELSSEEIKRHNIFFYGNYSQSNVYSEHSNNQEENVNQAELRAMDFVEDWISKKSAKLNQQRKAENKSIIQRNPVIEITSYHQDKENNKLRLNLANRKLDYGHYYFLADEKLFEKCYREYFQNYGKSDLLIKEEFRKKFQPMMIANAGIVFTSDHKALLLRRDPEKVLVYPNSWHICGGGMEPEDLKREDCIFHSVKREIYEEIGKVRIEEISLLGMTKHIKPQIQPILIFAVYIREKAAEIIKKSPETKKSVLLLNPVEPDSMVSAKNTLNSDGKFILYDLYKRFLRRFGSMSDERLFTPSLEATLFLLSKLSSKS